MADPEYEKVIETPVGQFLIRPYQDDDEEKVIQLWETAFKSKMDRHIWRWKFHDNPFGRQIMLCVTDENKPVAAYAGIPYKANWNDKQVRFTQLIDNMSHPEYRFPVRGRKGLYALTVECFVEEFGWPKQSVLSYGFPGQKHFKLGKLFFNYREMAGGGAYLKIPAESIISNKKFSFRKTAIVESADSHFDNLQSAIKEDYPFAAIRDKQFINWRFFENPVQKYIVFIGKTFVGKPISYLVLSIKGQMVTIVDIFTGRKIKEAGRLILCALKTLNLQNAEIVQVWLPAHHFITKELLDCGFEKHPEPIGIIPTITYYHPDLSSAFIDKNIFYTMADADLF